jgi:hypothetical protein
MLRWWVKKLTGFAATLGEADIEQFQKDVGFEGNYESEEEGKEIGGKTVRKIVTDVIKIKFL